MGKRSKKEKEKKSKEREKDKEKSKDKHDPLKRKLPIPVIDETTSSGFPATIDGFYSFMRERETIRLHRFRGDPWPWTDDFWLRSLRLANIKRDHDRTGLLIKRLLEMQESRWMAAKTIDAKRDLARSYVLTTALWRRFGTADFIDRLGFVDWPESENGFNQVIEKVIAAAVAVWREGLHACTDAYYPAKECHTREQHAWKYSGDQSLPEEKYLKRQTRIKRLSEAEEKGDLPRNLQRMREELTSRAGEKQVRESYSSVLNSLKERPLRALWEFGSDVVTAIGIGTKSQTWRKPSEALQKVKGYSADKGVHAAEVIRDLFTTPLLKCSKELDSWAPVSKLARRCLNRLYDHENAETEKYQQELLEVFAKRHALWPSSILDDPSIDLRLHDVQVQLGEFERYLKARTKKPDRYRFHPRTL